MKKQARVMIAAMSSNSGKTFITCALLQALKNRKLKVAAFKSGPDYIDPMFHQTVLKVPSKNLDAFFSSKETTQQLLVNGLTGADIGVMEGAMGLYDGIAGIKEEGSSYHLATDTKTPVILVVNAKGMGCSVIPMIAGFQKYDKQGLIKGVILNQTSKPMYELLKVEMERELGICVLGYVPVLEELSLESRHLGLVMPNEIEGIYEKIEKVSVSLENTVSMEKLIAIADTAEYLEKTPEMESVDQNVEEVRIGIARDEAFCFYYEDNLKILEKNGAKLIPFSPIHDKQLPKNLNGIILGGGYPELYAKELAENKEMKQEIKQVISNQTPSIAECGGFMYLHNAMEGMDGIKYAMVGSIEGECSNQNKLVRFGYITISSKSDSFLQKGEEIKGHEFHHFDSSHNGSDCVAMKPVSNRSWECVHASNTHWWGYPHLYFPSNPLMAKRFVDAARKFKQNKMYEEKVR